MFRHLITMASGVVLAASVGAPASMSAASPSPATDPPVAASPVVGSPAPGSPGTSVAWQAAPTQAALSGAQLSPVVWTGSRFIAAGIGSFGAAFLDSTDGLTWHLQSSLNKDAEVNGLAVGSGGVVAVGSRGDRAASWWSADGLTWVSGPTAPSLRGTAHGSVSMWGATATDKGWLAVGEEDAPCRVDCDGAARRGLTWTSADGLAWDRAPHQPSLLAGALREVVRGGPGFVAVGRTVMHPASAATSSFRAAVWTSIDGRSWTAVPDQPSFHPPEGTDQMFGAGMTAVASDGDKLVAVGTVATQDGPGSALAWWSTDGTTWAPSVGDRFLFGQLFSVATVPDGFLATGPSGPDSCLGGIWGSADGAAWQCLASDPAFAGFSAYAAAASPEVEVVVGFGDASGGTGGAVWLRNVP